MTTEKLRTMTVVVVLAIVFAGITGCGKSDRDRYEAAMAQVITSKEEKAREMEHFDKMDKAEQCKSADYAEYFAILKKTSGGTLDNRTIKKTVGRAFEDKSADERAAFLKKVRAEMKD